MSSRKKPLQNTVAISVDCGCRRKKISDLFRSSLKTKIPSYKKPDLYPCSSTSWERRSNGFSADEEEKTTTTTTTTTTFSDNDSDLKTLKTVKGSGKISESVAVVKDSDDPYLDFRQSMLQMILEKEIYAKEDLKELLDCFLELNSTFHHEIIIQAFTEIWQKVFSANPRSPKPGIWRKSREI